MKIELINGFVTVCKSVYACGSLVFRSVYACCSLVFRNAHKIGVGIFLLTASCHFEEFTSFSLNKDGISAELKQKSEILTKNLSNLDSAIQKRDTIRKQNNDAISDNCRAAMEGVDKGRFTSFSEVGKLQQQQNKYDDEIRELSEQTKQSLEDFKNTFRNILN